MSVHDPEPRAEFLSQLRDTCAGRWF